MHLSRFAARFALALVVAALVLLAHARYHMQLLELAAFVALIVWSILEIRHAYRERHHP